MQYNVDPGNLPRGGRELNILWSMAYRDIDSINCSLSGVLHNFNFLAKHKVGKNRSYPSNQPFGEGEPYGDYGVYIVTLYMKPETNPSEFENFLIDRMEQYTGKKMQVTSGR